MIASFYLTLVDKPVYFLYVYLYINGRTCLHRVPAAEQEERDEETEPAAEQDMDEEDDNPIHAK